MEKENKKREQAVSRSARCCSAVLKAYDKKNSYKLNVRLNSITTMPWYQQRL